MSRLVLATGNAGKVRELSALLAGSAFTLIDQRSLGVSDVAETGLTFVENALIKARHAARETGLPAIADDSGLVVPALNGAPGIWSARYAGENATDQQNIDRLLEALRHCPADQRQASFHCVLVFLRHADDPVPLICHGSWAGEISAAPDGDGGFGYDPIFWLPEHGVTAARLSAEEKNRWSHRGQALRQLQEALRHG